MSSNTMKVLFSLLVLFAITFEITFSYSALKDAQIIAEFRKNTKPTNHAKVARTLVHQASWSAVGTISTNSEIPGFPMVNIISIDDNNKAGKSTGIIHFLLTDLDFTGNDWKKLNKVTFLFTDDQNENCKRRGVDPMEPTCARSIISGQVIELGKNTPKYNDAFAAFIKRHPASSHWVETHSFYLCELNITNIFVLDYYGGPHIVEPTLYYSTEPGDAVTY